MDLISVYLKESKGSKSELKMFLFGNFTVISEFWCIIFRVPASSKVMFNQPLGLIENFT